ncbi:MAG: hypothetical protein WD649_03555 [Thermoleophilaceae bacterium]
MSRENVEIVRELAESFRRGEAERAFDFYDPGIEWDMSRLYVRGVEIGDLADVYHGHDAIRTFWRSWLEVWKVFSFSGSRVVRVRYFPDHPSAMKAAGLR